MLFPIFNTLINLSNVNRIAYHANQRELKIAFTSNEEVAWSGVTREQFNDIKYRMAQFRNTETAQIGYETGVADMRRKALLAINELTIRGSKQRLGVKTLPDALKYLTEKIRGL